MDFQNNRIKYKFIYSATLEMVKSLHVIVDPEHHTHCHTWIERILPNIPKKLLTDIKYIGNYCGWAFVMDLVAEIAYHINKPNDVNIIIKTIGNMNKATFAIFFTGLSLYHPKTETIENFIVNPNNIDYEVFNSSLKKEDIYYFFKNVDEIRELLISTLKQYWNQVFIYEWNSIDDYLNKFVKRGSMIIERNNPISYVCSLHNDIFVQDKVLFFRKEETFSTELSKIKEIVITPSIFSYPHLYGNIIGSRVYVALNMNYNAVILNNNIPTKALNLMHILADETRFKIVKILWKTDATTSELADILTLSPSTVSLHLKLMKEADVVQLIKVNKFVYYKLNKKPFFQIQKDIIESFE